jgi:hypothetical protein
VFCFYTGVWTTSTTFTLFTLSFHPPHSYWYPTLNGTSFTFLSFFFGSTGAWTWGLGLARQVLYHLSHSASPFCVGYFWGRVSLYTWAGLQYDSICASQHSWDDSHFAQPFSWDVVMQTFCPEWPWTAILLISTSWVARSTGLNHCAQPCHSILRTRFCI